MGMNSAGSSSPFLDDSSAKRLSRNRVACRRDDDGLKVHLQLIAFESNPQFILDLKSRRDLLAHLGVEQFVACTSARLGVIHGVVCRTDYRLRTVALVRKGNAHAGSQENTVCPQNNGESIALSIRSAAILALR